MFPGEKALGNGSGIYLSSTHTTVGGTDPGTGNVISGNRQDGIDLVASGDSLFDVVQGNLIGTDAAAVAMLGNGSAGIFINGASDNLIGSEIFAGRRQCYRQ